MGAQDMEFEAGAAPTGLPAGAATATNAELPDTGAPSQPDVMEGAVVPPADAGPEEGPAGPADFEPVYEPATDDEMFLAAPTARPDEAQFVGAEPRQGLPPNVRRSMSLLQEAAASPNASANLKALAAFLLRNQ